jgi:predicted MFS family arabinose efflux permease
LDVTFLALANMFWPFGQSMYIGYFPLYIEELGGSKLVISLLSSVPYFMGLFAILGGYLADRMDRKGLLLFGWAITVPAPLIWAFADRWELLLVGQVLYSLTAVCIPAFSLYVFDYKASYDKMVPYSLINAGGIAGAILAPSVGAAILARYDMKTLFLSVFVAYLLSTLCILLMSKQTPEAVPEKKGNGFKETFLDIKKDRTLYDMLYFAFILFCMNISEPYVSVFLSEHHHMSVQMIGTAFTCLFIGASLFTWLFGKNTSKYKPVYIVLFGILLFWIGITAVTVNRNPYIVYAGLFSRGVNRAMLYFVQGVLIQRLKAGNKGLVLSIFVSLRNTLIGIAAYPGAFLYNIHPIAPFITEGLLLFVWISMLFFGFGSCLKENVNSNRVQKNQRTKVPYIYKSFKRKILENDFRRT